MKIKQLSYSLLSGCLLVTPALAQEAEDEHHAQDEIIVTAVPLERSVDQIALTADILGRDELAEKQETSIGETLANQLGVSSSYFGPVASRPVIRGQQGERVRVLSNGLDSLDVSGLSEDHAVSIDTLIAERVEIIRGPATLLYGGGATGGIVNVVDNRIARAPLDRPFSGAVAVDLDDATGRRTMGLSLNAGTENLAFHLDWFDRETDDIEIPGFAESALLRALEEEEEHDEEEGEEHDHEEEEEAFGVVENSSSQTEGGAGGITLTTDNGSIGFSVSRYLSDYGIPGGHHHHEEEEGVEEEEEEEEEIVTIGMEQTRYDFLVDYAVDGWIENVKLNIGRNDYKHTEFEGDEVGTQFDNSGTDARLVLRHRPSGRLQGAFGLQFKDIDFSAVGEEAFVPPSNTEQLSLFAYEEFAVNDTWTLQGAARIENQSISTPGQRNVDETAVSFSIGSIWDLTDALSLSANLSLSERNPNATELYANGPHVAVQRFEVGAISQGLGEFSKESATNLDLTLRGRHDRFEWSVTGFSNTIDDYILLSPTAAEEDEFQVFEFRQADVTMYGAEAEVLFDFVDNETWHAHVRLFGDFVFGEEDSNGVYLPHLPPLRFGAAVHATRGPLEFGVSTRWNDEQTRTANNELPTDSFTMVGAEVSYRFDDPNVFVFLRGSNLTDEDARRHTSALKDLVPLPGRSISAGVRFDF
ncbi:MAG: TonB-dependent receptor [Pseudomonadota bacterium]